MLYPELNFFKRFALTFLPRLLFHLKLNIMRRYEKPLNFRKMLYLVFSPELETFSYDLTNQDELIKELAIKLSTDPAKLAKYAMEFKKIKHPKSTLVKRFSNAHRAKISPKFGRNFIRYLIIREFKPTLIVETGTKDGLGSLVISSASIANHVASSENKNEQKIISMDIAENSGHFLPKKSHVEIYKNDSLSVINDLFLTGFRASQVLLISDSKPGKQIADEFRAVAKICTKNLIVMSNGGWDSNFTFHSVPNALQIFNLQERSSHEFYRGNNVEVMICEFQ